MNHFISLAEHPADEIRHVLDVGLQLRARRQQGQRNEPVLAAPLAAPLAGKTLAMIFEKPSLRTRVSFEQAMIELGGHAIVLGQHEIGLGQRESVADVARVLGGMVQGIAARVFDHQSLHQLAEHSGVPVVNMLSDYSHPCQALADAMTIIDEFGADLTGRTLAFIGDGNNVARSLAWLCAKLAMRFVCASPDGYTLEPELFHAIRQQVPDAAVDQIRDPREAARHADVIVTDTFVSMGQEAQKAERLDIFRGYQVNEALLAAAPKHAIVLHCLPAYRGVEITDAVLDGPQSRAFPEAHNRLHAQKGLLAVLMGGM